MAARAAPDRGTGTPDVVLVGSGINALVCAALLSRAGAGVVVLERAAALGGAIRTSELTVPGFSHDLYSAWHPLFVASEAYAILAGDLERHGLGYACGHEVSATVTASGGALVMTRTREQNAAEVDGWGVGDGARYLMDRDEFDAGAGFTMTLLSQEMRSAAMARAVLREVWRRRPHGSSSLVASLTESARSWLSRTYRSPGPATLFAPWVLHTGLGPDAAGSAAMNRAIVALLEQVGLPVPVGGAARLVDALRAVIEAHGGTCRTGTEVDRVLVRGGRALGVRLLDGEVVGARRAVVCGVTPPALYGRLLVDAPVPKWARDAAARFRFGRAGMQIHYALSSAPRWRHDDRLARVPLVHLTTGLAGVSRAVGEAERGLLPVAATVVCGQPCVLDPSRAPEGSWILWVQLQELPARPEGDAADEIDVGDGTWTEGLRERYADRVQARLAAHIEDFESSVLARVALSPCDIARENPNLVGGDIYAGACELDQALFFRPRPELAGHATPVPGVYHVGASTHPGPGLGAVSGTLVAKHLLGRGARRS
jgi:phytoene dehydrogenase-like protein